MAVVDLLLRHNAQSNVQDQVRMIPAEDFNGYLATTIKPVTEPHLLSMQLGYTALMEAAGEGHAAVVDLLLRHDAQVDMQSKVSSTLCIVRYVSLRYSKERWWLGSSFGYS